MVSKHLKYGFTNRTKLREFNQITEGVDRLTNRAILQCMEVCFFFFFTIFEIKAITRSTRLE